MGSLKTSNTEVTSTASQLEFSDIHYTLPGVVDKKKVQRRILSEVSGVFKSGQLTALMGASGSGKSTLLNILSGRLTNKGISGST